MNKNKAIAYLRQLCCLGLGKYVVIPKFLEAIKNVIPSNNNLMTQLDEHEVPFAVIINEFIPEICEQAKMLIPTFHTPGKTRRFREIYKRDGFITEDLYSEYNFFKTDFYHLVWLPLQQHYLLLLPVYLDGRLAELLWLFRPKAQQSFSQTDKQLALQLMPYVTHALQKRPDADSEYLETGDSSLIVADCRGKIVYLGTDARRLLTLATRLEQYKQGLPLTLALPSPLVKLCHNINGIFKGDAVQPPVLTFVNPYGKFTFRAYWLDHLNREPDGLVGITIKHHEPKAIIVMRGLKQADLTITQNYVAYLVCEGSTNEQIGLKLHLRPHTVKGYVQKILVKMDIHYRDELMPKLSALAKTARMTTSSPIVLH